MNGFQHRSVLLREVVAALEPRDGQCHLDGTLGGGGHAEAVLQASAPSGRLFGCDRDPDALAAARERLRAFAGRLELRQCRFEDVADWIGAGCCHGAVLDLGVSAWQFESPARGFSVKADGPLDMRMQAGVGQTAADLVNEMPVEELARMFWELGDERDARRIARALGEARQVARLETTRQLAALIERQLPARRGGTHPATKVFQALRMAVNDELGTLRRGLPAVWRVLKPGGRLACISFHSGEARAIRAFARPLERDYEVPEGPDVPELRRPRPARLGWVRRKAIVPSAAEIAANPRARSAQLWAMVKLTD